MREDQKQKREREYIYRQSGKKRNRLTKNGQIKLSDYNLRNAVTAPTMKRPNQQLTQRYENPELHFRFEKKKKLMTEFHTL